MKRNTISRRGKIKEVKSKHKEESFKKLIVEKTNGAHASYSFDR